MQKKLTVLFAFAIFVLIVGLHTDSYACHKGDGVQHGKKPCDDGGGGGGGGGGSSIPVSVTFRDCTGGPVGEGPPA